VLGEFRGCPGVPLLVALARAHLFASLIALKSQPMSSSFLCTARGATLQRRGGVCGVRRLANRGAISASVWHSGRQLRRCVRPARGLPNPYKEVRLAVSAALRAVSAALGAFSAALRAASAALPKKKKNSFFDLPQGAPVPRSFARGPISPWAGGCRSSRPGKCQWGWLLGGHGGLLNSFLIFAIVSGSLRFDELK
jgi:hypothetical protein